MVRLNFGERSTNFRKRFENICIEFYTNVIYLLRIRFMYILVGTDLPDRFNLVFFSKLLSADAQVVYSI